MQTGTAHRREKLPPQESYVTASPGRNGGRRRRYRCQACGKTFCTNTGTPYHRIQRRRVTFDDVAALSVEGLNKSAIVRVKAGLTKRRLTLREIFSSAIVVLAWQKVRSARSRILIIGGDRRVQLAA